MAGKLTKLVDIRRKELRQAALEVLQREGMAGATLEKVATHAGASKGIVLHYFRNKQELFEQAMREANANLRDAVAERLRQAKSPRERLAAIIEGNFDERFYQPATAHAWLSLCAEVPREPQLARIQAVIHARMRSNLLSALNDMLCADEARRMALLISSLIDGLWLRLGLQSGGISRQEALAVVNDTIRAHLDTVTTE
ncbi:transcriptional regulator BetI [Ensifer sp. ENS07]|uniref:choline-binding transcriptional repressor BetI n=1 Tax=Ensifer sp. ENS07 TaxID=2769274 RepID=UPI00177F0077|nr:transcriptional regulator BetI [Ensifer sp. ENS07]MBD9638786.1 transcriptional regulator BetI [Ensifer sp. ENS07]